MKSFDDLTLDQRLEAYRIAKNKLREAIDDGSVVLTNLADDEFLTLAEEIAENATYDENGRPYAEGADVPYYFLGGCV